MFSPDEVTVQICASKYWLVESGSLSSSPERSVGGSCVTAAGQTDESLYLWGFDGVPEPDEVNAAEQNLFHLCSSTSSFPSPIVPSSFCQPRHLSPLKSSHHFLFFSPLQMSDLTFMSSLSSPLVCHEDFSPVKRLIKPHPTSCLSLSRLSPVHLSLNSHPLVFLSSSTALSTCCQQNIYPSRQKTPADLISHCVHAPHQCDYAWKKKAWWDFDSRKQLF